MSGSDKVLKGIAIGIFGLVTYYLGWKDGNLRGVCLTAKAFLDKGIGKREEDDAKQEETT